VERVLQPQGLEVRVDAAAAGVLAHAIMRRFYEEFIGQTGQPRLTPGLLAEARGVHASVAEEAARAVRAVSVSEEVQVRATVRQTWRLLEADATLLPGMTPVYREWAFGMPDEPESFGDFLLRGRVDRIDADDTRLVVTDYKLGGISHTRAHTHFASEGLVQLPLYAAVAARRLGRAAAGGVYRSMKGGKPRGFIDTSIGDGAFVRTDRVDAAAAQAVISGAIERTREAVGGMRAGRIDAEPPSAGCPGYCAARTFCAEWRPGDGRA
jgi:ATP-dependent helicase/DNAse subunit B